MSLEAIRAQGHVISAHTEAVASRLNLNWGEIFALLQQWGPQVLTILEKLFTGTTPGDLIAKYGNIALAVLNVIFKGLAPVAG